MSNEFIGRNISLAIAPESTRGVAEASAIKAVRKVECNLIPVVDTVVDDSTTGDLEDSEGQIKVRERSEGDVSGILRLDEFGYFLSNLYGLPTSEANGDGFDHTFELEQTITHPTLTFFVKDGEVRQAKIGGVVVSSFEITASTDNFVRYTAKLIGKAGVTDASSLPAQTADKSFVGRDVTVKIASSLAGLTGATALKIKNWKIAWNTNAEADYVLGSYSPDNIYNKQFAIEGEFEKNLVDEVFHDMREDNTSTFMEIEIKSTTEISTGVYPTIKLTLHKVQLTSWNRGSGADELVTEVVGWKAYRNVEEAKQSTVVITNEVETYVVGS
jgi:hypothetical protein